MDMAVNGARQEVQAAGIKHVRRRGHGRRFANGDDALTMNGHAGADNAFVAHDLSAGDDKVDFVMKGGHSRPRY